MERLRPQSKWQSGASRRKSLRNFKASSPAAPPSALSRVANAAIIACEVLETRYMMSVSVLDAGFEAPALTSGTSEATPSGSAWTFSGPSGVASNGSSLTSGNPNAPEGSQVLYLAGAGGSVSQSVSGWDTTKNYTITVSAAQLAGASWDGSTNQQNFAVAGRAYHYVFLGGCVIFAGAVGYYWSATEPRRKQVARAIDEGQEEPTSFPLRWTGRAARS